MPVKLQLSYYKTSRNLLLFIYLNLCSTKYSLGVVKYSLHITKYGLGEAVCSRLLQVSIYSIRGYTLRRAKLYKQKKNKILYNHKGKLLQSQNNKYLVFFLHSYNSLPSKQLVIIHFITSLFAQIT